MNDVGEISLAVAQAADRLEAARRNAQVADLPAELQPRDLAAGFQIQAELARRAGAVGGWKISFLTFQQQAAKGVDAPIAARMFAPWIHASPAKPAFSYIKPMLECEFAFALSRDLPQRSATYSRGEVEAAIGALHPVMEIVDSRLPSGVSMPVMVADSISNGGFVYGPATDWRGVRYPATSIALSVDGVVKATGSARAILGGDPIGAVVLLANHQPPNSEGLKRGQFVTTGSCTGMTAINKGERAVADFGPLGKVEIDFTG
jgi:2-keto-4-pentenoate hydratase